MNLDEAARALLVEAMTPRRRARTRLAEPLRDAEALDVETPNGKVAAWRLGEGPAVLCVHGWQDDNSLWSRLISALAEMGVPVVAFDLPGHGFSEGDRCTPLMAGAAIEAVAARLGPIDAVVTHSFGGPALGRAIIDGFTARRLALIASPRGRRTHWFREAAAHGVPEAVIERARELLAAEIGPKLASFDFAAVAPPIETLVLHSLDDDAVEWESGKAIADAWPNATFVACDGLGHRMIAQDRDIIQQVVAFVA